MPSSKKGSNIASLDVLKRKVEEMRARNQPVAATPLTDPVTSPNKLVTVLSRAEQSTVEVPQEVAERGIRSGDMVPDPESTYQVTDPKTGSPAEVPGTELNRAFEKGFKLDTPELASTRQQDADQDRLLEEQGQHPWATFGKVAVDEALFGLPKHLMTPEARKRFDAGKQANPLASGTGVLAGVVGSIAATGGLVTGITEGAAQAGARIAPRVAGGLSRMRNGGRAFGPLTRGVERSGLQSTLGRSLQTGARFGVENAVFETPRAITEATFGDPEEAAESLLINVGLGFALGSMGGAMAEVGSQTKGWLSNKVAEHRSRMPEKLVDEVGSRFPGVSFDAPPNVRAEQFDEAADFIRASAKETLLKNDAVRPGAGVPFDDVKRSMVSKPVSRPHDAPLDGSMPEGEGNIGTLADDADEPFVNPLTPPPADIRGEVDTFKPKFKQQDLEKYEKELGPRASSMHADQKRFEKLDEEFKLDNSDNDDPLEAYFDMELGLPLTKKGGTERVGSPPLQPFVSLSERRVSRNADAIKGLMISDLPVVGGGSIKKLDSIAPLKPLADMTSRKLMSDIEKLGGTNASARPGSGAPGLELHRDAVGKNAINDLRRMSIEDKKTAFRARQAKKLAHQDDLEQKSADVVQDMWGVDPRDPAYDPSVSSIPVPEDKKLFGVPSGMVDDNDPELNKLLMGDANWPRDPKIPSNLKRNDNDEVIGFGDERSLNTIIEKLNNTVKGATSPNAVFDRAKRILEPMLAEQPYNMLVKKALKTVNDVQERFVRAEIENAEQIVKAIDAMPIQARVQSDGKVQRMLPTSDVDDLAEELGRRSDDVFDEMFGAGPKRSEPFELVQQTIDDGIDAFDAERLKFISEHRALSSEAPGDWTARMDRFPKEQEVDHDWAQNMLQKYANGTITQPEIDEFNRLAELAYPQNFNSSAPKLGRPWGMGTKGAPQTLKKKWNVPHDIEKLEEFLSKDTKQQDEIFTAQTRVKGRPMKQDDMTWDDIEKLQNMMFNSERALSLKSAVGSWLPRDVADKVAKLQRDSVIASKASKVERELFQRTEFERKTGQDSDVFEALGIDVPSTPEMKWTQTSPASPRESLIAKSINSVMPQSFGDVVHAVSHPTSYLAKKLTIPFLLERKKTAKFMDDQARANNMPHGTLEARREVVTKLYGGNASMALLHALLNVEISAPNARMQVTMGIGQFASRSLDKQESDPRVASIEIGERISNAAVQELGPSEVTGRFSGGAPTVSGAFDAHAQKNLKWLASNAPRVNLDPTGIPVLPDRKEAEKYLRYVEVGFDPASVKKLINDGTLTKDHVEAMKNLYPKKWDDLIADMIQNDPPSDPTQRRTREVATGRRSYTTVHRRQVIASVGQKRQQELQGSDKRSKKSTLPGQDTLSDRLQDR